MYFKIQRNFLQTFKKPHLLLAFRPPQVTAKDSKVKIIEAILNNPVLAKVKYVKPVMYFHYCGYCRAKFFLVSSGKAIPLYCGVCGKTSPNNALNKNFARAKILLKLATQLRNKDNDAYKALLEQCLVSTITSLEIALREAFSSIYDQKHIVHGTSLFAETYSKSRNEFLNFGNGLSKIKSITGSDIKMEIGELNFKLISKMYSTRHVIVHNASIKDKEYINQTGEDIAQLNKPVSIDELAINDMFEASVKVSKILDRELRAALLRNHMRSLDVASTILEAKTLP